jgi:uncharacterized membrane protein YwzB
MKYNSIREYFYKLHNLLYGLLLTPLLDFVVLYWQMQAGNIEGALKGDESIQWILLGALGSVVVADWGISYFLFYRGMLATRTLDSLGKKLDRYFSFTFLRFALVASSSLGLAVGFFLTENQMFTVLMVASFAILLLVWPTPSKVCNDLQLKGDEQTLVLYKKDRL